jgi:hypothetical protein
VTIPENEVRSPNHSTVMAAFGLSQALSVAICKNRDFAFGFDLGEFGLTV